MAGKNNQHIILGRGNYLDTEKALENIIKQRNSKNRKIEELLLRINTSSKGDKSEEIKLIPRRRMTPQRPVSFIGPFIHVDYRDMPDDYLNTIPIIHVDCIIDMSSCYDTDSSAGRYVDYEQEKTIH